MAADELGLTNLPDQLLRTNAEIEIVADEQPQLRREIQV